MRKKDRQITYAGIAEERMYYSGRSITRLHTEAERGERLYRTDDIAQEEERARDHPRQRKGEREIETERASPGNRDK